MQASDQITLRSAGSTLRAALEREAARRGTSLDRTILALLSERLGLSDDAISVEYEDLDELAGTWTKAEASRFEEGIEAQRQVDARLWR